MPSMVYERVRDVVNSVVILPENADATLEIKSLGVDSLDVVEMVQELEEEFDINIPDEEAQKWATLGDIVNYVEKQE